MNLFQRWKRPSIIQTLTKAFNWDKRYLNLSVAPPAYQVLWNYYLFEYRRFKLDGVKCEDLAAYRKIAHTNNDYVAIAQQLLHYVENKKNIPYMEIYTEVLQLRYKNDTKSIDDLEFPFSWDITDVPDSKRSAALSNIIKTIKSLGIAQDYDISNQIQGVRYYGLEYVHEMKNYYTSEYIKSIQEPVPLMYLRTFAAKNPHIFTWNNPYLHYWNIPDVELNELARRALYEYKKAPDDAGGDMIRVVMAVRIDYAIHRLTGVSIKEKISQDITPAHIFKAYARDYISLEEIKMLLSHVGLNRWLLHYQKSSKEEQQLMDRCTPLSVADMRLVAALSPEISVRGAESMVEHKSSTHYQEMELYCG